MFNLIFISIVSWLLCFSLDKGTGGLNYWNRGGGDDPDPPPAPAPAPSPMETTQQSIDAQVNSLPKILEAQKRFGPEFSELNLESLRKFGPQFAQEALDLSQEFGGQFSEQVRAEQEILAPERVAGSEAITGYLEQGPDQLDPFEEAQLRESVRAAGAVRGFSQSGANAGEEISRIFGARQALKDRYLNVALSASGRLPAAQTGGGTVQGISGSPGQLVQNVTPSTFFGGQASQNASNNSIFSTQAGLYGTQLANQGPGAGGVIGGIVGGALGQFAGGFGSGAGSSFFSKPTVTG